MFNSVQQRLPLACLVLCAVQPSLHAAELSDADTLFTADRGSAWSANATVASQYVSRGFRQSWGRPAAQAGIDIVDPSGWSGGTWFSTVSDRVVAGGSLEWDLYGGYSAALGPFGYSLMAHYYKYPGAALSGSGTRYDYGEISAGISYKALYAKYNYTVTRNFFGIAHARGTGYLDGGANLDLGSATTLNLHLGEGRVAGAGNDYWNWRDIKVGVTHRLGRGWKASGAYTRAFGATHAYERYTAGVPERAGRIGYSDPGKNTFVLSLTRVF